MSTPNQLFSVEDPLRLILSTETDANSPVTEVTFGQLRLNWEAFVKYVGGMSFKGTVTADPNDAPDGILPIWLVISSADPHDFPGRFLIIRDGDAISNILYIVDWTEAGTGQIDSLTLSANLRYTPGDPLANLWSLGVRSGNSYAMIHNLVQHGEGGHGHNGVNSARLAPGSIGADSLKIFTLYDHVYKHTTGESREVVLPSKYGFAPGCFQLDNTNTYAQIVIWTPKEWQTPPYFYHYGLYLDLPAPATLPVDVYVEWKYVAASGEVNWLFVKMRDGKVLTVWAAPDHPCGCCGDPEAVPHPYFATGENEKPFDIIVINPSSEEWRDIQLAMYPTKDGGYLTKAKLDEAVCGIEKGGGEGNPYNVLKDNRRGKKSFDTAFLDTFEIDFSRGHWTEKPITVGLPDFDSKGNIISDYRNLPQGTLVYPIKQVLEQPKDVSVAALKRK